MLFKPVPDIPKKNDSITRISTRFRWRIENFSRLKSSAAEVYSSDVFKFGSYKWHLIIYPKGQDNDNHISIFLENTWYNSSFASLGSSTGSCWFKSGSFSGTASSSTSSSYSVGSPIASSWGLASAYSGTSSSLASTTNSGPSSSLASVNLWSSYSPSPEFWSSFRLSSRDHLQNMEYSLSVLDQIHNKYTVRKDSRRQVNGNRTPGAVFRAHYFRHGSSCDVNATA
ncbi:hypothetical protein MKW98_032637 [Papaver atlanticum]|uniref:MATH domain-containing protein n=1 Tax=Papaver atlanticum TaxID=357466 RepID=A0AAD4SVU6_9MAGN|nr:hypothetical protein MKW98_032637 [Papaver atlanticum]